MKKRLISLLLVMCISFTIAPLAMAAQGPTQEEAYQSIIALKDEYYEGRPWTNENFYAWNGGGLYYGGYGCAGFAYILSDAAFGTLPSRDLRDITIEDVRVGDILRINHDTHSVVVLEVYDDYVVIAEGNYNESIHWGRTLSAAEVAAADYLTTRYPEEEADGEKPEVPAVTEATEATVATEATQATEATETTQAPEEVEYNISVWIDPDCATATLNKSTAFPGEQIEVSLELFDGWTVIAYSVATEGDSIDDIVKDEGENYAIFTFTMPESDVWLEFDFDSGENYNIECSLFSGSGMIVVENDMPAAGETVSITITPSEGYRYESYMLNSVLGDEVMQQIFSEMEFEPEGGTASFTMPEIDGDTLEIMFLFVTDEEEPTEPAADQIQLGEELQVDLDVNESCAYEFTPDEDGTYVLYYLPEYVKNGDMIYDDATAYLYGPDIIAGKMLLPYTHVHDGASLCYQEYNLRAGTTYSLEVKNNEDAAVSYALRLGKLGEQATSLCLDMNRYWTDDVGSYQYIYAMPELPYQTLENVTWTSSDESVVRIGDEISNDGRKILMVGQGVATVTATLPNGSSASCAVTVSANPFTDVAPNAWYVKEVGWAVAKGITTGVSETQFAPENVCTRSQIVTFLWRSQGSPEPASSKNPFVDVKKSDYFYKAVLWAVENGITNGMDATHFAPDGKCTRGQVVTFLHRAAGKPAPKSANNPFTDVKQDFYTDAVLWAVGEEITTGMGDGTFAPGNTCTRAQIVTFLYRYMNN